MTTIQIPDSLVQEIEQLRQAGLTASPEAFAQEAIREKVQAAQRESLAKEVQPLREDLATIGLSEAIILHAFERFRHAAHANR